MKAYYKCGTVVRALFVKAECKCSLIVECTENEIRHTPELGDHIICPVCSDTICRDSMEAVLRVVIATDF